MPHISITYTPADTNSCMNNSINNHDIHLNSHLFNHQTHHLMDPQITIMTKTIDHSWFWKWRATKEWIECYYGRIEQFHMNLLGWKQQIHDNMTQAMQDLLKAHQERMYDDIITHLPLYDGSSTRF